MHNKWHETMEEKNNRKMLQSEALVSSWNGFKLGGWNAEDKNVSSRLKK